MYPNKSRHVPNPAIKRSDESFVVAKQRNLYVFILYSYINFCVKVDKRANEKLFKMAYGKHAMKKLSVWD